MPCLVRCVSDWFRDFGEVESRNSRSSISMDMQWDTASARFRVGPSRNGFSIAAPAACASFNSAIDVRDDRVRLPLEIQGLQRRFSAN